MGQLDCDRPERRKHAAVQEGGVPRRHMLFASITAAAAAALAATARAGTVSGDAPPQAKNDSSIDELTAHRRDYYRRARF